MSEIEWTNEAVIRLMEEYRKRPELWDSRHDLYRVQTAKYEAWSDLASLFECDIVDLRKKLNSVFASHRREKAKVRLGERSNWFLYPYMSFMPTHLPNGNAPSAAMTTSSNKQRETKMEKYDDSSDDVDQIDTIREEIIIKQESPTSSYAKTKKIKPRLTRLKKRVAKESNLNLLDKKRLIKESSLSLLDNRLLETLRLLRRSELNKKKDECDSFGEYISDSLRKHDERTQSMIKQAINNILFEQEMKKYNNIGQFVVISGIDENPLILSEDNSSK